MDLIIRRAKLRKKNGLFDIGIKNGIFAAVEPNLEATAVHEINALENLAIPPFIDPHLHLDAVLTVGNPRYNESGTLLEGIEIWGDHKASVTKESIKKNADKVIKWLIANGTLKIRTHADTTDPSLITVEALVEVKKAWRNQVDIQIVAFPQDGIFTRPDSAKLMQRAVEIGADVIGGIPHHEITSQDGIKDVEFAFELARKHNCLVDIHVDETGDDQSRFIEVMAKQTLVHEMQGQVAASHATAMHNYNNDYALKLMGILKRSGINVITNPFDNSVLQNRTDGYPRKRGHARVDELLTHGINVCIGHDSIMDPWYPLGKGSMLQAANLLLHTAHMSGYHQISQLFDMITDHSAKTLCVEDDYGIQIGKPADMVILDARDEMQAIRLISECLYVIRRGAIISQTTPAKRKITLNGRQECIDFK
ncbi:MAG: cytosine deaminase [Desulfobacteraceae bacterium]|nr:cytosine deaminase [Desulfobacteraceae bacterium]